MVPYLFEQMSKLYKFTILPRFFFLKSDANVPEVVPMHTTITMQQYAHLQYLLLLSPPTPFFVLVCLFLFLLLLLYCPCSSLP